ncbi:DNA/RNA non-specific endonuclease [Nonomuraea sp. NPDC050227]|uniref:DNA/RNA non-specific endonuclease n=1 Tax=Nonomuraea sp. NPDC050227 TaxID=3364360 RepID=UPI0037B84D2B
MTRLPPVLCAAALAAATLTAPAQAAGPSTSPTISTDAAACIRHLAKNHTYKDGSRTYTTDGAGRPAQALAPRLARKAAARSGCEATVGNWGGSGDWQGGHLIASSFSGASLRYNLVPMRGRQINQGLMLRVENGARACLEAKGGAVADYRVQVHYPDGTTVIPDRIHVSMAATISGVSRRVTVTFPNATLSARELDSWHTKITNAFRTAHCMSASDKA